ncbi:MAG: cupin domain-containing protein [Pseudonocardiaceae bacterium]|nr:cupin domain-containing protein [Pseudonocardiaceae bacterium]
MLDLEQLGARIQAARTERGLTLSELAEYSSVSVSMLSSVERGGKAPTVVVLARIAEGLQVRLTSLLADPDNERVIVRRAAEQDTMHEPDGWTRTVLSPVVPGVNFEWVRTTLPPGCDAGTFPAYAAGSHEYVVVHSGSLRLTVDDRTFELTAGDSVYFAADVPHGYANHGRRPCTYYIAALIMRPRRPGVTHNPYQRLS